MSMYNLIEYSNNYSRTSGILREYCRDETTLVNYGDITNFNEGNANTNSFKTKEKEAGQQDNNHIKNVEIMVPQNIQVIFGELLKHLQLIVKLIFI